MKQIEQKTARCTCVFDMEKSLIKTLEGALCQAFQSWYDGAIDSLETALFDFVEMILTETVNRGNLDDMFKLSIEKCVNSATFMDTFTSLALTLSFSSRLVEKVIHAKIEIEWNKDDCIKQEYGLSRFPPHTSSLESDLSKEKNYPNLRPIRLKDRRITTKRTINQPQTQEFINTIQNFYGSHFIAGVFQSRFQYSKMQKVRKEKRAKANIHVLQTVKKHYAHSLDYRKYRLANQLSIYDETVSS